MWGWWGWHGDDVGTTGTTWGQHGVETTDTTAMGDHMGTFWGLWGWCGGWWGMMGMTQGWHGDDRDDMGMTGTTWGTTGTTKITKNAITFEQIEIIEFCLKIWDPWALPHTYTLYLMYSWGGVLSQMDSFYPKPAPVTRRKFFFLFFALDPIRPYLDWAPDHIFDVPTHFTTLSNRSQNENKVQNLT